MSEMVERVAKAIRVAAAQAAKDELDQDRSIGFRSIATAAIAAMREPTEAMMAVQDRVRYLRDMWPEMIDAALREE